LTSTWSVIAAVSRSFGSDHKSSLSRGLEKPTLKKGPSQWKINFEKRDASLSGRTFPAPNAGGAGGGLKGFQEMSMQATHAGELEVASGWYSLSLNFIVYRTWRRQARLLLRLALSRDLGALSK